jgi:hypothetical protein
LRHGFDVLLAENEEVLSQESIMVKLEDLKLIASDLQQLSLNLSEYHGTMQSQILSNGSGGGGGGKKSKKSSKKNKFEENSTELDAAAAAALSSSCMPLPDMLASLKITQEKVNQLMLSRATNRKDTTKEEEGEKEDELEKQLADETEAVEEEEDTSATDDGGETEDGEKKKDDVVVDVNENDEGNGDAKVIHGKDGEEEEEEQVQVVGSGDTNSNAPQGKDAAQSKRDSDVVVGFEDF